MAGAGDRTNLAMESLGGYRLLEEIGAGSMGTVFKASSSDGSLVAVKVMARHYTNNVTQRKRFEQEARLAMRLTHPSLVRAIAAGEEQGVPFFVMELVEGETLAAMIQRLGRLPEPLALRMIASIARGVHEAHKLQLIHRDIKPENILLTTAGEPKLADLGLVKSMDESLNLTSPDRGVGTPRFMAPEQFRAAKEVDYRCDIYALGETFYMMVTGQEPFTTTDLIDLYESKLRGRYPPPESLNPSLHRRTLRAIQQALQGDPAKRPASARDFVRILRGKDSAGPSTGSKTIVAGATAVAEPLAIAAPDPAPTEPYVSLLPVPSRPPCTAVADELARAGSAGPGVFAVMLVICLVGVSTAVWLLVRR